MTSTEKSASAHLPAARVWLQRGEGLASALISATRGLSSWFRRAFSALERAQARRMALRELYALDNRLLQDIGLSRDEIRPTVSAMFRKDPVAEATHAAREVNAVGGTQAAAVKASNDGHYQSAA